MPWSLSAYLNEGRELEMTPALIESRINVESVNNRSKTLDVKYGDRISLDYNFKFTVTAPMTGTIDFGEVENEMQIFIQERVLDFLERNKPRVDES